MWIRAGALLVLVFCLWTVEGQSENSQGNVRAENRKSVGEDPIQFHNKAKDLCTMGVTGQANVTKLRISCQGVERSYWCEYTGKPYMCRAYNSHPRHYFTQIMWDLRKLQNACLAPKAIKPQMCKRAPVDTQMVFSASSAQDAAPPASSAPEAAPAATPQKPDKTQEQSQVNPETPKSPNAKQAKPAAPKPPAKPAAPKPPAKPAAPKPQAKPTKLANAKTAQAKPEPEKPESAKPEARPTKPLQPKTEQTKPAGAKPVKPAVTKPAVLKKILIPKLSTPKPTKPTVKSMAEEYCWQSLQGICSYVISWFHN